MEGNQGFTSFDFLTLVFSFALIIFISVPILKKNLHAGELEIAQRDVDNIAESLLRPNEILKASHKRGIASVETKSLSGESEGRAGLDPWGNPYRYVFIRNSGGNPTHVLVWSIGPDGRSEIPESKDGIKLPPDGRLSFRGDDLGTVLAVH